MAIRVSGNIVISDTQAISNITTIGANGQITTTVATGTSPLAVSSTTKVANLNADLLDDYNTATTATANTVVIRDSTANITANFYIGNGSALTGVVASSVPNALTLSNAGTGGASGTTYNGSAAVTVSYNSIGAPSTGGANATGTWPISITGSAGSAPNPNALTINNAGTGAASGTTYTGAAAVTISYNSIGAPSTGGANASGTWPISITGSAGSVPSTTNALTINNAGTGAASGSTFNGGAAVTISYNTIGAPSTGGANASGTWPINVTGSAGSATTFTSTTQSSQFNAIGVGTAASATAGTIQATNNITAYVSDKRLKTDIEIINNALEKLLELSGVYFRFNEVAKIYGYDNDKKQVGVIAQEVQKVLPEIVVPAPFDISEDEKGNIISKSGENYQTVWYDKIVPLIIQAIKELTEKVNILEKKVNERV